MTLESPLDCKEIKSVNPKQYQFWILRCWTDAEAETPILWPPDAKNWLVRKDPDAGKVWRQEEKGMTEGKMVGWHHWLNGHEFEQAPGVVMDREAWHAAVHWVTKSQTRLSDWTELNWTDPMICFLNNISKEKRSMTQINIFLRHKLLALGCFHWSLR